AWASGWAERVVTADAVVGACTLRNLPVKVRVSEGSWATWWVPLPHIGGTALRYVELVVRLDSATCKAVTR
ncbi:MAG: hypothetical protein ACREO3_06570, partial [Arenimonas sp.]